MVPYSDRSDNTVLECNVSGGLVARGVAIDFA